MDHHVHEDPVVLQLVPEGFNLAHEQVLVHFFSLELALRNVNFVRLILNFVEQELLEDELLGLQPE